MTVHPDGQLLTSRAIVEYVPSAAGQMNLPFEATPKSQLVVALDGFQAVNATSTEDSDVQDANMDL